jgi:hypothetical protein
MVFDVFPVTICPSLHDSIYNLTKTKNIIRVPPLQPQLQLGLTRSLRKSGRRTELVYFFWELLLFVGVVEDNVLKRISPYDIGCDLEVNQ